MQSNRIDRLVLFLTNLLTITLPGERFFYALLLAWFEIEGMTLDLFDDVFGLYFALEAAQSIFERFTFLYSNLCQGKYTSQSRLNWLCIKNNPYLSYAYRYFSLGCDAFGHSSALR